MSVKIYRLSATGERLARGAMRSPSTDEWQIIHHLHKRQLATQEQLVEYGSIDALTHLIRRGIIERG